MHLRVIDFHCIFENICVKYYDKIILPDIYDRRQSLSRLRDIGKNGFFIKAHGCISYPETIVFTTSQYENAIGNEIYKLIMSALFIFHPILTIGYSLTDLDFIQLRNIIQKRFEQDNYSPSKVYSLLPQDEIKRRDEDLKKQGITGIYYKDHSELSLILENWAKIRNNESKSKVESEKSNLGIINNISRGL